MKAPRKFPVNAVGLVALLGLCGVPAGCGGPADGPPGVLLVTIDTCRADRIGCYGAPVPVTPVIDDLAGRGTVFEQATAPVPLTLPSHATVLTGLYPDRHGIRDNGAARLPDEAETLAELLARQGWRTAAFVSAYPLAREFGTDQGFAIYDDDLSESSAGTAPGLAEGAGEVANRLFYDERIAGTTTASALAWLEEAAGGDRPFLAWVHYFDPHATYRPPPHVMRPGLEPYDGEIAYVDEQIGRLLAALGDAASRVVVVVTADHGESLGQHGEATHGLFLYESTLRVPWVMAGPGVPAGERVTEPVSLADVLPTVLDAVDLAAPEGIDGETRLPLARGTGAPPAFVFAECLVPRLHFDWAALRSVRRGNWKLIEAPRPELYDLGADPHEESNVLDLHPELADELRAELAAFADRGGALGAEEIELDAEARERLERLGYVGSTGEGVDADLWNPGGEDPKDMVDFFNRLQELPTVLMNGQYDEGERLLLELREEDPDNSNVLEKLALLERLRENWPAAIHWCREFLELKPEHVRTRMNLAWALKRTGDLDGAREAYERVLEIEPDHADAWALLGALESDRGRTQEAIEALRRGVEVAPDDVEMRTALAQAREQAGDETGALADYDRALQLAPNDARAVNGKALLLSHAGRPREAVEVLRAALPALQEDVDTLNNLAWILVDGNLDPVAALAHAREAERLAPQDPVVLDTLGWSAVRAGRPAEAISPLTRALEATGDAEVRAHLGVALAESGREAEGREQVRAAVQERPELARIPEVAEWR
jgi:arylsulfatase A-like enzyme/Flp pilus assembly protein TadD